MLEGDIHAPALHVHVENRRGLEQAGLVPSPEADRTTLIRRLHLDLLGLPPTPEEVDAFVNDASPDAYEKLVDRLLRSPHFGERWGRHWLDLARYAETDGFEHDAIRPHSWRYRDYVIRAFNADVPYDQFVHEHVAGDLLPNATRSVNVPPISAPIVYVSLFCLAPLLLDFTFRFSSRFRSLSSQRNLDVEHRRMLLRTVDIGVPYIS